MGHTVIHDLLVAEIEAFPFASPAAFELDIQLLAQDRGVLSRDTERLARALESRLRPRMATLSLETLAQLRDGTWFRDQGDRDHVTTQQIPLHAYLARLAARYLQARGEVITLASRGEELRHAHDHVHHTAERYRWLSLLLPPDLLLAALATEAGMDPRCDRVSIVTSHVAQVLRGPVADTHLHVGAAVSFSTLWTALMISLSSSEREHRPSARDLDRQGPPPFGTGKRFLTMLLSAAIGRTLLASFLWGAGASEPRSFRDFLGRKPDAAWSLRAIAARMDVDGTEDDIHERLLATLDDLCGVSSDPRPISALTSLYRRLVGVPSARLQDMRDLATLDPIATVSPPSVALPETLLARRALRYLADAHGPTNKPDEAFAHVFWQYQRVRCLTYRHLAQEPSVSGLDWFQRHFQRISALRKPLAPFMTACALDHQSPELHLSALEARTSPDRSWTDIWRLVRAIARQARDHNVRVDQPRAEVGLVLHFLKEREWGSPHRRRLHADPTDVAFGCRHGRWFRQREREASSIVGLFKRHPEALLLLRGVDVASTELSMPTWPTVPLIARVREASAVCAERLAALRPEWHVPPMRVTYHVGEDYRRLVEGLRRIHELIEFGVLRNGDRIGHGVALGDAPERWAGVKRVLQPAEERLDDLLWELDRYGRGHLPPDVGRVEYVRFSARELTEKIYGADVDVDACATARRRRHDPRTLEALGFPARMESPMFQDGVDAVLFRYLTDPGVFERGRRPVEVDTTDSELAMLRASQDWLRRLVAKMEITVESNPSSNLLIGSFLSIDEHPAFRLQPLRCSSDAEGATVLLSVNVDDPVTFASRLADEYGHLYFALLRSGVPSQDALAWLDRVRENGWRSRFTVPASARAGALNALAGPRPRRTGGRRRAR